jgi:membrane-bound ClpP family serine protease
MTGILLLFLTGALLLTAEVFLPGAIAGIIGACALAVGSAFAFMEFGAGIGSLATAAALLLVGVMLYVELVWLPRTRFGRGLVVHSTVEGQSQPPPATPEVIGQAAVALTTLAPSGWVEIAGRRYEAFCRSGHATRGSTLKVVGLDNFRVIVTENNNP